MDDNRNDIERENEQTGAQEYIPDENWEMRMKGYYNNSYYSEEPSQQDESYAEEEKEVNPVHNNSDSSHNNAPKRGGNSVKIAAIICTVTVIITSIILILITSGVFAHSHIAGRTVIENEIPATCKSFGIYDRVVYCSKCDEEISRKTVTTNSTQHTPATAVKENETASTCSEKGSYDEVVYCSECNEELSRTEMTANAVAHAPAEAVIENEVAATCTESGSYDEVVYCAECSCEIERSNKTVSTIEHNYENHVCIHCGAPKPSDGLKFAISSDKSYYILAGIGTCKDSNIIIPEMYEGLPVKEIGHHAFKGYSSLTSITIPDSVTSIGDGAFSSCSGLINITIPDSVTSIANDVFFNCSSLTSITIPNSVTRISYDAFVGCYKLVEVINHSSLNITAGSYDYGEIAYYAKEVHTGESKIVDVNDYLFYTYNAVNYLLGYANDATELVLPENYNGEKYEIYKYAFYNRSDITSVVMSSGAKTIGDYAFSRCNALKKITFTSNSELLSIGHYAFYDCLKLVEVINHSSLDITADSSNLGDVAYYAIEVHTGESKIVNANDYLFYTYDGTNYLFGYVGDDTELVLPESYNGENYEIYQYAFYDRGDITNITIPSCVETIGYSAFYGCKGLKAITFAENSQLSSVGGSAFHNCTNLTSITIPDSVTSIGSYAFSYCSSLTSVTIGDSVTSIDDYAFSNSALVNITIPSSVTHLSDAAFKHCYSLRSIMVDDDNIAYKSIDGNLYTKDGKTIIQYAIGKTDESFVIPSGVTRIDDDAFSYCSSLTNVTIPNSVTYIECSAFYHCTNITNVTIPNSVTSIGFDTFIDCTNLTSITIPEGVTSIGWRAFYNCSSLTSITIPEGVTSIGSSAFVGCYKLVEVINHSSLDITAGSENYEYVAYYAKEVHTGESKIVNVNDYLFYTYDGANYLLGYVGDDTELVLPESYNGEKYEIYKYAFYKRDDITSVTIPDSVTSIGSSAFYECYKLVEVINHSSLDITAGSENYGYVARYAQEVHTGESKIVNVNDYIFYTYNGLNYLVCYIGDCSDIILPDSYNGETYEIRQYAFRYRDDIISIAIPDSVTNINGQAFYYCTGLKEITFAENSQLLSIDNNAFYGCSNLTSVIIPNSITSIEHYSFGDCDNLISIVIPSSVTSIDQRAFSYCDSLTSVTFENPDDWYTSGMSISADDLSDPATAAKYLRDTYSDYYWYRK